MAVVRSLYEIFCNMGIIKINKELNTELLELLFFFGRHMEGLT